MLEPNQSISTDSINLALTNNSLNGRRRQKNIVSISFNLLAWCVEVLGDMLGILLKTYNFHLAFNLTIVCSCGLTPIIYLIGAREYYTREGLIFCHNFFPMLTFTSWFFPSTVGFIEKYQPLTGKAALEKRAWFSILCPSSGGRRGLELQLT